MKCRATDEDGKAGPDQAEGLAVIRLCDGVWCEST
jgi:hypothetical protein